MSACVSRRGGAAVRRGCRTDGAVWPSVPRGYDPYNCFWPIRIVMGLNYIGVNTSLEKALKLIHLR